MAEGRGRARADAGEYARRVNVAVELLESGMSVAEAARVLAQRLGCSVRQARRYAEQAAVGPVAVPAAGEVFTVRLPAVLVARVRQRARASGRTISSVVAQALEEFLVRGNSKRPRR